MEDIVRPAILGLMVGCVVVSLVALVQLWVPDWDGNYVMVFCGLTAVEAYFSYRLYRARLMRVSGGARFRLLELAGVFVALQLCVDAADGFQPLQDGVPQLEPKGAALFLLVFFLWLVATATARDLDQVGEVPTHALGYVPPPRRLAVRFFMGGALLFVMAGLTQTRIADALKLPEPSTSGPVLNVLLYFLLGMLMLGQVRYSALRRRWREREMAIAAGLGNRWTRYILAFVGLVVLLALLLPTSYTMSLLDLGREARDAAMTVLTQLVSLIGRPLAQLLSLLGITPHPNHPIQSRLPIPPSLRHLPRPQPHHSSGHGLHGGWGALVQSLLFWSAVLITAVYLIRSYVQRHPRGQRIAGKLSAVLGVLGRIWAVIRRGLRRYARKVAEHVPLGPILLPHRPPGPRTLLRFVRPDGLSAREQVLYYYLSIVRQADRRGFPRRPSQTPHEFNAALAPSLHDVGGDMTLLTDTFVEARYSHHDVEEGKAGRARTSWQRVRDALRRVKNKG